MPKAKAKGSPQKNTTNWNKDQPLWSSDHSMLPPKQHETFRRLLELFSQSYDTDVIQAVAQNCNYSFDKCLEILLAMSDADPTNSVVIKSSAAPPPTITSSPVSCATAASVLAAPAPISAPIAATFSSNIPVLNISSHKSHSKGRSHSSKKHSAKSKSKGAVPKSNIKESNPPFRPDKLTKVEKVKILIKNEVKVFILMRGLPGSGKTHLANSLGEHSTENGITYIIVSADNYFMNSDGEYNFRPNELSEAHMQTQKLALESAKKGVPVIIVDNTNTRVWEMACYAKMAITYCYHLEILEPETPWRTTPSVLYRYTVHNVPLETIERMVYRWESIANEDELLEKLGYTYTFQVDILKFLRSPPPLPVCKNAIHLNKSQSVTSIPPGFSGVQATTTTVKPQPSPFITKNQVNSFFRALANTSNNTAQSEVPMVSAESVERQLVSEATAATKMNTVETLSNSQTETSDVTAEKPYEVFKSVTSGENIPSETVQLKPLIKPKSIPESEDDQEGAADYLHSLKVDLNKTTFVKEQLKVETADLMWDGLGDDWTLEKKEPTPVPSALGQRVSKKKKICSTANINRNWLPLSGNTGILILKNSEEISSEKKEDLMTAELASSINFTDEHYNTCDASTDADSTSVFTNIQNAAQELENCNATLELCLPTSGQGDLKCIGATDKNNETECETSLPDYLNIQETPNSSAMYLPILTDHITVEEKDEKSGNTFESDDSDGNDTTVVDSTLQYLLDTQCSNGEDFSDNEESSENALETLNKIFPQISSKQLVSILGECHGNVDWAIDFILHSPLILQEADELQKLECNIPKEERVLSPVNGSGKVTSPTRKEKVQQSTSKEAMKLKHMIEDTVVLSNNNHSPRKNQRKKSSVETASKKMTPPPGFQSQQSSVSDEEDEEEEKTECLPMTINKDFAEKLLVMFGGPLITRMPDFSEEDLTMQVPVELARLLHTHWLESLQQRFDVKEKQLNQLLKNDEQMAIQLQELQNKPSTSSSEQPPLPDDIPDLKDIMEMEMALALVKNDQKGYKNDMATKLSRQLLAEQFPKFDPQALDDVFDAHNRHYQDTVDFILESIGDDSSVCTVIAPELLAKHEQQLLERARQEAHKMAEECKVKLPLIEVVPLKNSANPEEDRRKAMKIFYEYREEAQKQWQQRCENLTRAQNAYRQGMKGVASYYSEVCQLNKQKMDMFNSAAASALFGIADDNLLDLHYLYVTEALQVLDVFLDHHARRLQSENVSRLYSVELVTGRGRRSEGGKSRLKPAVIHRLKQRRLRYEESNPGALRVFLTRSMTMSSNN